jgi:thymidylate kinase
MGSDLTENKGIVITFSGVDGAGKSTILENTRRILHDKYRKKVVVLRHRPSLLPILSAWKYGKKNAEQKAANSLPRQGNNDSSAGSFFRFCYYYSDYLLGQFYVNMRYVRRGYTVLYDRYYFDFIVDARRSNIKLPKGMLKWGYHLVLKPEVNIFLYAPADEILKRKQELSRNEIEQLTGDYKELFEDFRNHYHHQQYLSLNNTDLDATMSQIEKHCIEATF